MLLKYLVVAALILNSLSVLASSPTLDAIVKSYVHGDYRANEVIQDTVVKNVSPSEIEVRIKAETSDKKTVVHKWIIRKDAKGNVRHVTKTYDHSTDLDFVQEHSYFNQSGILIGRVNSLKGKDGKNIGTMFYNKVMCDKYKDKIAQITDKDMQKCLEIGKTLEDMQNQIGREIKSLKFDVVASPAQGAKNLRNIFNIYDQVCAREQFVPGETLASVRAQNNSKNGNKALGSH